MKYFTGYWGVAVIAGAFIAAMMTSGIVRKLFAGLGGAVALYMAYLGVRG